jgi:sulfoxide reductase heme-binding subunit YedZ
MTAEARPSVQRHRLETEADSAKVSELLSLAAGGLIGAAAATAIASAFIFDQPMPDDLTKLMWYAIRVSGVLAYLTLFLTTIAGLAISGSLLPKWAAILMPVHQLADLALSLALLHAALLLGDRYAGFTPETIVVPFRSSYEPFWSGLGIIALYLGAVVFWSVHIRPQIGYERWRKLHYLAFVVYLFALAHGLFAGTDRETFPLRVMYGATGGLVLLMIAIRTASLKRKAAASVRSAQR